MRVFEVGFGFLLNLVLFLVLTGLGCCYGVCRVLVCGGRCSLIALVTWCIGDLVSDRLEARTGPCDVVAQLVRESSSPTVGCVGGGTFIVRGNVRQLV